jgi:general stress protein 26
MNQVPARPLTERREAALERLRLNSTLWLATASHARGPYLTPLFYRWDGSRLTTATFEGSRTVKNVRGQAKVRAAIGSPDDVLMIDARATIAPVADMADIAEVAKWYALVSDNDPQSVPGFVYIHLLPERIQLWKGVADFTGRTVMRAGVWLEDPTG